MFRNQLNQEIEDQFEAEEDCSYRSSQVETNQDLDEFGAASLFFNQHPRKETSKNFAEMIEQSEERHHDFSGVESQISMGFIGSGALLHKDGV